MWLFWQNCKQKDIAETEIYRSFEDNDHASLCFIKTLLCCESLFQSCISSVNGCTYHYILVTHCKMIWEKYLFGKINVVDFLALVCSMIISEAWYAFSWEWRDNYGTILTKVFRFVPLTPRLWSYQATNILPSSRLCNKIMTPFPFCNGMKWAATWQNQQSDCAPSEDSDQPGHPPSLIRVFAVRLMGS